jgi:malate/lactate dehydrogenase
MGLMLNIQTTLLAIAISATVSGFGVWRYQSHKYEVQIAEIRLEQAQDMAAASARALEDFTAMQRTKDDAITQAEHRAQTNAKAAARAAAGADRLRSDLAKANARISTATREAVNQYAATIGDVFGQCVEEYRALGEKATGHASDVRLMIDSWPSTKEKSPTIVK